MIRFTGDDDYGIDGDVEIFEDGEATGLFFAFQLRATDAESGYLDLRFKASQWSYFDAVDRPVLLVRYHAPTGRVFARWKHRCSPTRSESSVAIALRDTDLLTRSTATALLTEVRRLRELQVRIARLPIAVCLTETEPGGSAQLRVAASAILGHQGLVRFEADQAAASATVELTATRITVAMGDEILSWRRTSTPLVAAADLLTLLAIAADHHGLHEAAAEVMLVALPLGTVAEEEPTLAAFALTRSRVEQVVAIGRALADSGKFGAVDSVTALPLLMMPASLTSGDAAALSEWYADLASGRYPMDSADRGRGRQRYANWLFSRGSWLAAVEQYTIALEDDPAYRERAYFCREFGAALFESGRYGDAIYWYERALALEDDPTPHALIGDCLMRLGRYAESLARFDDYLGVVEEPADPWKLLGASLNWAVEVIGVANPGRDPNAALAALGIDPNSSEFEIPDVASSVALDALQLDLLCVPAWIAYVRPCLGDGAPEHCSPENLLMASVLLAMLEGDIWYEIASLTAAELEVPELLDALVRYGVRHGGRQWPIQVLRNVEALHPAARAYIEAALLAATAVDPIHTTTLRIHHPDGTWETLTVAKTH